jgi:cephalosporin hydroxylase
MYKLIIDREDVKSEADNILKIIEEIIEEKNNDNLYCLGDIVHNSAEVERLKMKGLITINHDEFKNLTNCKVLLRAHGEPPETYKIALENNMIEVFELSNPENKERFEINNYLFQHIHREKHPSIWKDVPILKMPTDMFLFHKAIWDTKPDFILEIGTKYGGSALFMQDTCDMVGKGKVITIDVKDQVKEKDPRITYLLGDSISPEIVKQVHDMVGDKTCMIVIDGKHTRVQVKWELHLYKDLMKSGHYLVVEDCYNPPSTELWGPGEARDWFLRVNRDFYNTKLDEYFLVGFNMGGWLMKK